MLTQLNTTQQRRRALATFVRYATVLSIIGLYVATHLPGKYVPRQLSSADKFMHVVAYLWISFSVLTSWDLTIGKLRPQHYFTVWLLGTLYAAFDEITQIPVGRHCDGHDWLCDIAGIILGLTLFRLLRPVIYRMLSLKAAVT